jgi:DNA invertase Pin-like site-specific DNA recombinase
VPYERTRFGRSLRHLINALADLESLGVSFISMKDNLDLSTSSGRLMFQIIGAMAELEQALIRLRNARAKSRKLERPRIAVDAARIGSLRSQGRSVREIAEALPPLSGLAFNRCRAGTEVRRFGEWFVEQCILHSDRRYLCSCFFG